MNNKNNKFYFSLNVKIKNKGNIIKSAAYISRSKLTDVSQMKNFSYSNNGGRVISKIMVPENSNLELKNRQILWNTAKENMVGKQVARSFIIALPNGLDDCELIKLVERFCRLAFCENGKVVDYSIHLDEGNKHVHILTTMTSINPVNGNLGTNKDAGLDTVDALLLWRGLWEKVYNDYVDEHGNGLMHISSKSYRARGIYRQPTQHIGNKRYRHYNDDTSHQEFNYQKFNMSSS